MASAKWDAQLYDSKHAFVWEKARDLLGLLAPQAGERILDLGCGTGQLSAEIAASGADVVGVDSSSQMVTEARKKFPSLQFEVCDARELPFAAEFDAVFSNATLHWIPQAGNVASGVARALKAGGRFVAEFGGHGNVQNVVGAGSGIDTFRDLSGERESLVLPGHRGICRGAGRTRPRSLDGHAL